VVKADLLDRLLSEFAPAGNDPPGCGRHIVGGPETEVGRFYVAWNPAQLDGIVSSAGTQAGTYVAYLGCLDERLRCLYSLSLRDTDNLAVRSVGSSWRLHSWGITSKIAADLDLEDIVPVLPRGPESIYKMVTFCPADDLPKVREALFSVGAGRYGLYSKCSFSGPGKGTFLGDKQSKPAYGKPGSLEEMDEHRLEVLVPGERIGMAMSALRKSHPYEEPVVEAYQVESLRRYGDGRIGLLEKGQTPASVARRVVSILGSKPLHVSGENQCHRIMVWDGEPGIGLYQALVNHVDLYIGPDSQGLAALSARAIGSGMIEFPRYCFLMAGAKELVYLVREKSKRDTWGLRTFLPSKA
jgi:hypothetical protein